MTIKEVSQMFGLKEKSKAMKNKHKAKEIVGKIIECPKCKKPMNWVEGTNVCICPRCTYTVTKKEGKKEIKETFSVFKTISSKNCRFLENNFQIAK